MKMAGITEGNNPYTRVGDTSDPEKKEVSGERERWAYSREPWSPERERQVSMEVVSSGSMIEATGGFAAIILSILCMANVAPLYLMPTAALVIGVALLFEGGAIASRYWQLPEEITTGRWAAMELAGGMITEFFAGLTGVILGILALAGNYPLTMSSVAVLIFGLALLASSGLTYRLNHLEYKVEKEEVRRETFLRFRSVNLGAVGVQIIFGAVAVLLGIIALFGVGSMALTRISLLILGIAVLISGTAVSNRILHLLHRC
jgi:hypothetical protein